MSVVKTYICDVCGKDFTEEKEKRGAGFKYVIAGFGIQDTCFECFHIINKFIQELKIKKGKK